MAELLDGIARHLAALDLAVYDETGAGGDLFIESMPSRPGLAIVLTLYDDSREPDSKLGYDEPRMQVRVRGDEDPRTSRSKCAAIRAELHGLGPITLPGGIELILSVCLQSAPASIGVDSTGRHEHVCNFRMEHRSITTHRV